MSYENTATDKLFVGSSRPASRQAAKAMQTPVQASAASKRAREELRKRTLDWELEQAAEARFALWLGRRGDSREAKLGEDMLRERRLRRERERAALLKRIRMLEKTERARKLRGAAAAREQE